MGCFVNAEGLLQSYKFSTPTSTLQARRSSSTQAGVAHISKMRSAGTCTGRVL